MRYVEIPNGTRSLRTNRRWPTDTDGQLEALEMVGSRKCSTRHISLYILIMNSVFFLFNSFLWHQLKSVLQHATVCVYVFDVYWCILMFRNRATSKPEAVLIGILQHSADLPLHGRPKFSRPQKGGQRDLSHFLSWNFLGLGDSKHPKVTRVMAYVTKIQQDQNLWLSKSIQNLWIYFGTEVPRQDFQDFGRLGTGAEGRMTAYLTYRRWG